MKKVLLFTVVLAGLGFTSCSKGDFVCTCTEQDNTFGNSVWEESYNGVKESDAKDACESENSSYSFMGMTSTTTCVLKDA